MKLKTQCHNMIEKCFNQQCMEKCKSFILLVVRLCLGFVFFNSGKGKLFHLDQTIRFFESLHIPAASLQAPFVAGLEFLGGIFLIVGFCTRVSAFFLSSIMVVAIITAKWADLESAYGLLQLSEFLDILLLMMIICEGAGRWSVDSRCCSHCKPKESPTT